MYNINRKIIPLPFAQILLYTLKLQNKKNRAEIPKFRNRIKLHHGEDTLILDNWRDHSNSTRFVAGKNKF